MTVLVLPFSAGAMNQKKNPADKQKRSFFGKLVRPLETIQGIFVDAINDGAEKVAGKVEGGVDTVRKKGENVVGELAEVAGERAKMVIADVDQDIRGRVESAADDAGKWFRKKVPDWKKELRGEIKNQWEHVQNSRSVKAVKLGFLGLSTIGAICLGRWVSNDIFKKIYYAGAGILGGSFLTYLVCRRPDAKLIDKNYDLKGQNYILEQQSYYKKKKRLEEKVEAFRRNRRLNRRKNLYRARNKKLNKENERLKKQIEKPSEELNDFLDQY